MKNLSLIRTKMIVIFFGIAFIFGCVFQKNASAAEISTCSEGSTFTCVCKTDTKTYSIDTKETIQACNDYCYELNNTEGSYELSCLQFAGQGGYINVKISQFNVTPPASEASAASKIVDKDFIVPVLNIKIPGFSGFSLPEKTVDGSSVAVNFIAEYINAIYGWIIAAAALVAVVMMMLGGLQYVMSRGKSKYIEKAKTRITNAITGLVLLLAAYNIASLIDPNTINLNSLTVQYVNEIIMDTDNTGADVAALGLEAPDGTGTNGIPYFSQRDYLDAYPKAASCNDSSVVTIKTSGCGPTSMAMVLSHYGVSTDPRQTAASFISNGFRACVGTSSAAFYSKKNPLLTDNNLVGKELRRSSQADRDVILAYLKNKEPIVVSVGPQPSKANPIYPSTFTRSGHFIVLTGVNTDGTIAINDPNSSRKFITQDELWHTMKFAAYITRKP